MFFYLITFKVFLYTFLGEGKLFPPCTSCGSKNSEPSRETSLGRVSLRRRTVRKGEGESMRSSPSMVSRNFLVGGGSGLDQVRHKDQDETRKKGTEREDEKYC